MGTEIHCRSYLSGIFSMRDLNEDLSSSSWPLFYGDNTVSNGQYCNGFASRASINGYPGDNKEMLRQKMLEHEAVFKNQVSDLHRLYKVQRDMMDEIKRRELNVCQASIEPESSSSLQASQAPSECARTWHKAGFSLLNSSHSGTPTSEVDVVKSPMNCTKVNKAQPGPFPFPNSSTSKDNEVTDSRPPKVRKMLFDLHLPAEEYMDTEEGKNLTESKVSGISSYACNGNPSSGGDPSMELFVGSHDGVKTYGRADTSASASSLRGSIGLADLNDPPQIEESTTPSSIDFLGRTSKNEETRDLNQSTKPCVTGEVMHSHRGVPIDLENNGDKVQRFPNQCEAGSARSNLTSVSQSHQLHKLSFPSCPIQGSLNHVHHPPGIYPAGYWREDRWKEGLHHRSEFSDRRCDPQSNNHWEPVTSRTAGSYPFFNASCVTYSWDHHISSRTSPSSSFAPNVTAPGVSPNSAATMSRSFHMSQGLEPFGGKWQANASPGLNPGLRTESKENGFHDASASGSKGLQGNLISPSIDYWNCSRRDGQASDCPNIRVLGDFPTNPSRKDLKPEIYINLNEDLSKSSSNEVETQEDLSKIDGKSKLEDGPPALPWFKQRPEATKSCKNAIVIDVNQPIMPNGDCDVKRKETIENQVGNKLLGFPIYETGAAEDELLCPASTSGSVDHIPEGKYSASEGKKGMIDINVVCEVDDERASADVTMANGTCVRDYIDLNSCARDSEDPPAPCYEIKTAQVKVALDIDLEGPPLVENEDDNSLTEQNLPSEASEDINECISDEALRDAAEVMIAISSSHRDTGVCDPPEPSIEESLLWFVDAVTSCANESDVPGFKLSALLWNSSEEVDEFEVMTLQLAETKEENCIPRPCAPDIQQVDDAGANLLPSRPRRGQARRGRQRRDFQRDILPGLASLSRHEVTEDIQAFTGLMRATGHSWSSGLTRRNGTRSGSARGRRRAAAEPTHAAVPSPACSPPIQECANAEHRLEDRNLMGWWKTTRRPRRQRCPAGNTQGAH